jgi:hypothetical protein
MNQKTVADKNIVVSVFCLEKESRYHMRNWLNYNLSLKNAEDCRSRQWLRFKQSRLGRTSLEIALSDSRDYN